MSELAQALTGDSAAAPAAHIIEGINEELVHRIFPNVPHTIYDVIATVKRSQLHNALSVEAITEIVLVKLSAMAWYRFSD
jgi:hypothetical protein